MLLFLNNECRNNNNLLNQLKLIDKTVDYALIIRPDFFDKKTLLELKKKTKNILVFIELLPEKLLRFRLRKFFKNKKKNPKKY